MTDFHDLNEPGRGQSDWDQPINQNTRDIDRLLEVRDIEENRDDYEPKDGAKFVATDTNNVYTGDGDAWVPLATLGGALGDSYAAIGDGSATDFTFTHTANQTPAQVVVTPTTTDAVGDFHVSARDDTEVTITYASAPPDGSGSENLEWDVALFVTP